MMLKLITFYLISIIFQIKSYKILTVLPTPFKSHWLIGSAISKELAKVGHEVTFVSPLELKFKNVKNVVLERQTSAYTNAFDLRHVSPLENFLKLPVLVEKDVNFTLSHQDFQQLLASNVTFDAIVIEIFMADALYGLGVHFNCPVIGFTTFGTSMWSNFITATPNPTSYVPNLYTSLTSRMNFLGRFYNTIVWTMEEICWHLTHFPRQEILYRKFFPNGPPLIDVIKNISLILNNNHFTTSSIKPSMPNVIDIGGIYVEPEAKALPDKIQKFLDDASEGAILFSMGSIIQGVDWPVEMREAMTKVFGKLKQRVIWKYENETLPNKPDNVMISSWFPQRDILAHKNIKLLMTHGGLLSTTEAIMEGVPIIAIPIFGDQRLNMKSAEAKGFGKVIEFNEISEENLLNKIKSALNDEEVSLKAKEISKLYKDRPMTPQQSAVYWVEYVIRNKGAHHLKAGGLALNYIELHNLDVCFAAILMTILVLYVNWVIFKILIKQLSGKVKKTKIH